MKNFIFLVGQNNQKGTITPGETEMSKIGPLITTQWNQTSPYNLYTPSTAGTVHNFGQDYANRYPAGFMVVAMAQVATYYKPFINGINWNLASEKTVSDPSSATAIEVAKLISLIAKGSGTVYGANGSSTQTEKSRDYMKRLGIYIG